MKQLLTGVAIAAALAIAAPAWAQAPAPAPSGAPTAAAAAAPMAHAQHHNRIAHHHKRIAHHHMARRAGMGKRDPFTEQLNREELARIEGAAPMPPPGGPPANAGAGQGGPRASGH
jgi:hypothetical protein